MSRRLCEKVCFTSGHDMISLETGKAIIDPVSKVVAGYERKILCKKCGLSIEQVQNYRALPKSAKKENEP